MNAADTIRAAIERLEQQRDAATQPTHGPAWIQGRDDTPYESAREIYSGPLSDVSTDVATNVFNVADAALIVTLHRTIDAQLRILREAEYQIGQDAGFAAREFNLFLPLAHAILGEDTKE